MKVPSSCKQVTETLNKIHSTLSRWSMNSVGTKHVPQSQSTIPSFQYFKNSRMFVFALASDTICFGCLDLQKRPSDACPIKIPSIPNQSSYPSHIDQTLQVMPSHKLIVPTVPHIFTVPGFPFTHFKPLHTPGTFFSRTPHTTPHALELRVTFHCSDRDNFFLGTPSGGVSPTTGGGICGITSAAHELVERPQECSSSQNLLLVASPPSW